MGGEGARHAHKLAVGGRNAQNDPGGTPLCIWGVWRQALEFQVKCLRFRLLLVFQNDFAGRATFTAAASPGRQRNALIALLVVENMNVSQKRSGGDAIQRRCTKGRDHRYLAIRLLR